MPIVYLMYFLEGWGNLIDFHVESGNELKNQKFDFQICTVPTYLGSVEHNVYIDKPRNINKGLPAAFEVYISKKLLKQLGTKK